MSEHHFWYVDDGSHVRWAVRVDRPVFGGRPGARILFTSRDRQIATDYDLDKGDQELTRYELLELLAHAKADAVGYRAPDLLSPAA